VNQRPKLSNNYLILQPLLLGIMVAFGMLLGYKLNEQPDPFFIKKSDSKEGFSIGRVEQALRFIEHNYVDSLNLSELEEEALYAIFDKLDPYSSYFSVSEHEDFDAQFKADYVGIGIQTILVDSQIVVTSVFENSPAEAAGIKPLDRILEIDGVKDFKDGLPPFRQKTNGDQVNIVYQNPISGKTSKAVITLASIAQSSVLHGLTIDDSIAYVRIEQFNETTYQDFMETMDDLLKLHPIKHLVLDLRDNPGGYLPQAIKLVNQFFVEKDLKLLSTVGKSGKEVVYKSTGKTFLELKKVAVLINHQSASASEVVGGIVQDFDRGVIIGSQSFGKGMVQENFALNNGSVLHLTTSKFLLPSGRHIQVPYELLEDAEKYNKLSTSEAKYKSLRLSKPLRAGVGIDPDIKIEESAFGDAKFDEDVLRFYLKSEQMRGGKLSFDQLKSAFTAYYLSLKPGQKAPSDQKLRTLRYLQHLLEKGRSDADRQWILEDSHLLEAKKYFSKSEE